MGLLLDLGYIVVALLTLPWFLYRITVRGDWRSIPQRLGVGLPPPATGSIWLHGSSAGEIALLQPLVQRLEVDFPETPLVITTFSSTGFKTARKVYSKHRVLFFPADLSFVVHRFLRRFDPQLVIIVESDFWPSFLFAVQSKKIPVAVLNGKISNRSYQFHAKTRLIPMLLRRVQIIAVQNEEHASRFLKLGVSSECVKITGNMKYDLMDTSDQDETTQRLRERFGYTADDVVIIGGSLHGNENEVLIESFKLLATASSNVSLIIVPRYPTDVGRIQNVLGKNGLSSVRKTGMDAGKGSTLGRNEVLVVDTVGELRAFYGIADIAFVGGSLFYRGSNKGGHNLIEPAFFGIPVLFGPHNFSFADTVCDLLEANAGIEVADAAELRGALGTLVTDRQKRLEMGRRAKEVILKSQGVADRNYELLAPLLQTIKSRSTPSCFSIWSVAVYFLLSYALITLFWRGVRYPAYWNRWLERFGYVASIRDKKTVWIHAVSVGEVRAVSELINSLVERYPEHRILVTTTTPTGSAQVRDLFGDRVSHSYVPYDLPAATRRFMDRVDPDFAVIAETEFWPNLFGECRRRNIPLLLVNVRVSQTSLQGYRRVPRTSHAMLSNANLLCAQTKVDAQQLEILGVSKHLIHVTGNLKFDVPVPESLVLEGKRLREDWGCGRFVLIAASTHNGEERLILTAFDRLRQKHPEMLLVLVPRHPERFNGVARLSKRLGFNVACYSKQDGALKPEVEVLIGDTMGELQKFYVASDIAFVGGSLVRIGGHNILEACAVGVPVIFGPHMFHMEKISAVAVERGVGHQVKDVRTLVDVVASYLKQPALLEKAGIAARELVAENRGALDRTLCLIGSTLSREES